jgi:serine/threonine protein kinase
MEVAANEMAAIKVAPPPEPKSKPDYAPTGATAPHPSVKNALGVKHPYLAILRYVDRTLVVMEDVGVPLADVMQSPQFRQRWSQSRNLRRAFFSQVGLSALNLVDKVGLCHNDIRPPNIAFRGDSFCLLDFDFARSRAKPNKESAFAPLLPLSLEDVEGLQTSLAKSMCFSVMVASQCGNDRPGVWPRNCEHRIL